MEYELCYDVYTWIFVSCWLVIAFIVTMGILVCKNSIGFFVMYVRKTITHFLIKDEKYVFVVILMSIRVVTKMSLSIIQVVLPH